MLKLRKTPIYLFLCMVPEVVLHEFIELNLYSNYKVSKINSKNNLFKKTLDIDIELEITEDAELMLIFDDLVEGMP